MQQKKFLLIFILTNAKNEVLKMYKVMSQRNMLTMPNAVLYKLANARLLPNNMLNHLQTTSKIIQFHYHKILIFSILSHILSPPFKHISQTAQMSMDLQMTFTSTDIVNYFIAIHTFITHIFVWYAICAVVDTTTL